MKIKILVFVAAQTQAQGAFQKEALSLWSHLRQILHLISLVKISCWHSVVQGDGKAVSSPHQNTAVSTDDTAKANWPTNRTGLQLALSLLAFIFLSPGQLRPTPSSKRASELGKELFPSGQVGQCPVLGSTAQPCTDACRKQCQGLQGNDLTSPRGSSSHSTNWPRHLAWKCYCILHSLMCFSSRCAELL